MLQPRALLCMALGLLWLCQSAPAHAVKVIKYNIRDGGPYVINVAKGEKTVLAFSSKVITAYSVEGPMDGVKTFLYEVTVEPTPGLEHRNIEVQTEDYRVGVLVNRVYRSDDAHQRAEFFDGYKDESIMAARCEKRLDAKLSGLMYEGFEVSGGSFAATATIRLDYKVIRLGTGHLKIFFVITNQSKRVFPIETLRVLDQDRRGEHAGFYNLDAPKESDKVLAVVPAHGKVQGYVAITKPQRLGSTAYLGLIPSRGIAPAWNKINLLDPASPPDENKGRVSVHVQALGGLFLAKDTLGFNRRDATLLTGLGARLTYGFTMHLNFEAELVAVTTGEARFNDVMWDGLEGELARSGTLVRALFGGQLRFGRRYVPYVRLGLGAQGAGYNSRFISGGQATAMPESSIDVDLVFALGAGFDLWLAKWLRTGLTATMLGPVVGVSDTEWLDLEAGLYFGYVWP